MRDKNLILLGLGVVFFAIGCANTASNTVSEEALRTAATVQIEAFLEHMQQTHDPLPLTAEVVLDTLIIDMDRRHVTVGFSPALAHHALRPENTAALYQTARSFLQDPVASYGLTLSALGQPIENLIPNYYRADRRDYDATRLPQPSRPITPLVQNGSHPAPPTKGLQGRHLALWPSHGWYYEPTLDRWEWQRARLFQTVEDVLPMAFILPYLAPMLERAGAHVLLPRERDTQTHEVVVDFDTDAGTTAYHETGNWANGGTGFARGTPPYENGVNPFQQGHYRISATASPTAEIAWIPNLPEAGAYAVYVAYASVENVTPKARYTVHHTGGTTTFFINQQIGGGTWIYLGTFTFAEGQNPATGQVILTNEGASGTVLTADAVRFGGGMGNIVRNGQTSGRPRFLEAARYAMQYAGMPDTLVYHVTEADDDYRDDYQGRGEWVNYLRGTPFGPNKNREIKGLGIPIDLSLAFHTDAGVVPEDSTVGTLMIYSSDGFGEHPTRFPDGVSRFANRDLGDVLQTQIVADIRALHWPKWTRRSMWDRDYSEAFRPNMPSALLELLSHQNFADMQFALDPQFRFDASRAIYKGILRFLATQADAPYHVQPLPVSHVRTKFLGPQSVQVQWRPVLDPLEPTATPDRYIVYTRRGEGGFDNGILVEDTSFVFNDLNFGELYSFKVSAVNEGGESFPSEILAVARFDNDEPPVLIVNGFDRIAAPAVIDTPAFRGFADFWDQGVPDRYDLHYVGAQYDFSVGAPWRDDDAPGHGASHADYETTILAGNTFDFPFVHGQALQTLGRSFVSASDEAVMDGAVDLTQYPVVDLLLGEERETLFPHRAPQFKTFPLALQTAISEYLHQGGNLLVSGAYIGTDLAEDKPDHHPDVQFAEHILKYRWRTNHAAHTGAVRSVSPNFAPASLTINTQLGPVQYAVEAPDGLEPAPESGAETIFRYAENNISAGVAFAGDYRVVALGFPLEALTTAADRVALLQACLTFFAR